MENEAKLTVEILAIMIEEMDKRNDQRFQSIIKSAEDTTIANRLATKTALKSTEKALLKASQTSDKAILKADLANEKKFDSIDKFHSQIISQIAKLEVFAAQSIGSSSQGQAGKNQNNFIIMALIAIAGILVGVISHIKYH